MTNKYIYFDNAATSFYKPQGVKSAVIKAINKLTANPGRSGHKFSNLVAKEVFLVREKVKAFFNAPDYQVVFTKNCTEALNLAIFGVLKAGDEVIATCYEHNSVLRPLEKLKGQGVKVKILECELPKFDEVLKTQITASTKLVITTAISNVTGEQCALKKVADICKSHNLVYLIDAAQGAGHIDIDLTKIGATMLAFAGHKGLLATTGVGGLVVKNDTSLAPLLMGGTGTNSTSLLQPNDMPEGLESGTLPTLPIISLGAGIDFVSRNFEEMKLREQKLSVYLFEELKKLEFVKLYSTKTSLNVFSFNVGLLDSSFVANELNERYKICVRAGLHCAPLIHKKLGTTNQGAVRVSLDFNNTKNEVDYLIVALKEINKNFS